MPKGKGYAKKDMKKKMVKKVVKKKMAIGKKMMK